ncbi:MAG: leucine-rich repeat domain-containing protein [Bacteriovoracia bacterium]
MTLHKNLASALKERESVTALKLTLKESSLPLELFHFPNLKELYLEATALTDFPDTLTAFNELKVFQIRAPLFKGSLVELFRLPKLENLKALETPLHPLRLSLGGTRAPLKFLTLKGCELKELPLEFGELTTLEEIYLPQNKLTALPVSFSDLKKLKRLNLDSNLLTVFPVALTKLPQLKHVSMDNNSFSEEERERIQREFHLTIQ